MPKVAAGYAGNVQSERSQNPHLVIAPPRGGQDLLGRRVSDNTIVTLTAGDDPNSRINVENHLRANYSSTLNAGGIEGDEYGNLSSFGTYDTLTNSAVGRGRVFGLNGQFRTKAPAVTMGSGVEHESEHNRIAKVMQRKNEFNAYSSSGYYSK